MMKIIPETEKYKDVKGVRRISYCYLHGALQNEVDYDIFGFLDFIDVPIDKDSGEYYIEPNAIEDGIYPCEFEGNPCTFFYWKGKFSTPNHRGLVVYDNDEDSYKYAKECYEKKTAVL